VDWSAWRQTRLADGAAHALGYGDANLVVTVQGPTHAALLAMLDGASTGVASAADDGDPLGGSTAARIWEPLHAVMAVIDGF
jgi:hypothetical protein